MGMLFGISHIEFLNSYEYKYHVDSNKHVHKNTHAAVLM
jgi:hypothetical protein